MIFHYFVQETGFFIETVHESALVMNTLIEQQGNILMKRILSVVLLLPFLFLNCKHSVIPPEDTQQILSFNEIKNKLTSAKNGDTVYIPAGICSIPTELRIDSNITIIGAGIGKTIFNGNDFEVVGHANISLRISGISFKYDAAAPGDCLLRISVANPGDMANFRVDHCSFENINDGGRAIWVQGLVNGVIDHSTFFNTGDGSILAERDVDQSTWNSPQPIGTADAVYVEDCIFTGNNPRVYMSAIDGMYSARYVFRHNTVNIFMTPQDNLPFVCAHGNHSQTDGGRRGTFSSEIYDNTFNTGYAYFIFYIRGGRGVLFNNTINASTGVDLPINLTDYGNFYLINPATGDYWGKTYPTRDQINNYYIWNNTLNGKLITDGTNGNPLFVRDRGYDRQNIQNGRDYFEYDPGYTPYTYPHPLVK
jgi:hypothetical protein